MTEQTKHTGLFVTFEGPEGCGKSTQIGRLSRRLEADGIQVVRTREPGGTPIADALRAMLTAGEPGSLSAQTELLLVLAARSDHVDRVIRPALEQGKVVLCDRYMDSTIAYQGAGRNVNRDTIDLLNDYATGGLVPDVTFLLRLDPEVGLARAVRNGGDRFERETLDFHRRVLDGYIRLAEENPSRFEVVDGARSEEEIQEDIYQRLWSDYPSFARS